MAVLALYVRYPTRQETEGKSSFLQVVHLAAASPAWRLFRPMRAGNGGVRRLDDVSFPFIVKNDRVRRQACFQAVLVRSIALSVTTSLRMQAVSASLAGLPA